MAYSLILEIKKNLILVRKAKFCQLYYESLFWGHCDIVDFQGRRRYEEDARTVKVFTAVIAVLIE